MENYRVIWGWYLLLSVLPIFFVILISNRQPDFGLPCLGGDLKSAAIPVLCGNPVTELIISGFSRAGGERGVPLKVVGGRRGAFLREDGGGGREAFLREDGEEDKCWECSE